MTNAESRSLQLEEERLWDAPDVVANDAHQITRAEPRELAAYAFDSEDQTWVGMGISAAPDSSAAHFASNDRTWVGIGPLGHAAGETRAREADEAPESVPMPLSEPPGPFIADSDVDEAPAALPMHKGARWAIALPVVLLAAAGVAVANGMIPRVTTTSLPSTPTPVPRAAARAAVDVESQSVETSAVSDAVSALPPVEAADQSVVEPSSAIVAKKADGAKAKLGSLDITSSPPSNVVLDGRPLGKAPRVVSIAPGLHTVVFVHPQRGRMLLNVNVNAGQTTVASADF
jgi:hypothetical protein